MVDTSFTYQRSPNTSQNPGKNDPLGLDAVNAKSFFQGIFMVSVGDAFTNAQEKLEFDAVYPESGPGGNGTSMKLNPAQGGTPNKVLTSFAEDPIKYGLLYYPGGLCRDTTLGGNDALNCYYQYNYRDDVSVPFTTTQKVKTSDGNQVRMGRVYAETINAVQSVMYLGFGVPQFNNLSAWAQNFYNPQLGEGVSTGYFGMIASAISEVGDAITFVPRTILRTVRACFGYYQTVANGMLTTPITNFYSFRSMMPAYYAQVQTLLIILGTNMNFKDSLTQSNPGISADQRAQIYNESDKELGTNSALPEFITKYDFDMINIMLRRWGYETENMSLIDKFNSRESLAKLNALNKNMKVEGDASNKSIKNTQGVTQIVLPKILNGLMEPQPWWIDAYLDGYKPTNYGWNASLRKATMFIGFRIERGNNSSESFSNSTQPSSIQQALNSLIGHNYEAAMMDASNTTGNLGTALQAVLNNQNFIKASFAKLASVAGSPFNSAVGNMATAIGAGISMADIPEVWSDSSFSTSYSFNLQLVAPYGDPVTILQTLYIPLACLIAGTAPRATGTASYTSPFLCQAYCRGRFAVSLGMIDSLSIDRGSSSHGWTQNQYPRTLDISFSIKDLVPNMPMGLLLNTTSKDNSATGINHINLYDQAVWDMNFYLRADTTLQRYLMTLAALSPEEMLTPANKLALRLREMFQIKNEIYQNYDLIRMAIANATLPSSMYNVYAGAQNVTNNISSP